MMKSQLNVYKAFDLTQHEKPHNKRTFCPKPRNELFTFSVPLSTASGGQNMSRHVVTSSLTREHELNVDMFLNDNIFCQNLLHVFLFRNMSTFNSCSLSTIIILIGTTNCVRSSSCSLRDTRCPNNGLCDPNTFQCVNQSVSNI